MPRSRSRSFESITRSRTLLVGAEDAALAQHGVDERGLAVVDVGDDGDVANGSHAGLRFQVEGLGRASAAAVPQRVPAWGRIGWNRSRLGSSVAVTAPK